MTRLLFVGAHAAAAAALVPPAGYDGPEAPDAVREALEEAGVERARRRPRDWADLVVDTDAWQLPEPVGLCLEEARELLAAIAERAR
jgi:hypothetical protein